MLLLHRRASYNALPGVHYLTADIGVHEPAVAHAVLQDRQFDVVVDWIAYTRGEVMGGDEAGQAVEGERTGRRRGLGGEEMPGDEEEERHGGAVIPARPADRRPARRFHHAPSPSSWGAVVGRVPRQGGRVI